MLSKKKNSFKLNLDFLNKDKNFDFLKKLQKKFPKAEIYLVGGAVRDLFLKKTTKDYDFVVCKVKVSDLEKFLANLGQVEFVGKSFGVFKFTPKGGDKHNPFDIALPRRDFSFNTGGYRDVKVLTNPDLPIEEDLSRRDFTINALALSIVEGMASNIIDPFNGLKDLKNKIIKTVGKPEDRFKEDYSRMLRAIRFNCQLDNDWQIEKMTWQVIKSKIKLIAKTVPYEIIAREFLKSFYFNPVKALDLFDQSGFFEAIMPEILKMKKCPQPKNFHSEGDVWVHTRLALEKLFSPQFKKQFNSERPNTELIIATLFHDLGKPPTIQTPEKNHTDRIRFNEHDVVGAEKTKKICERLKFSSPGFAPEGDSQPRRENFGVDPEKIAWLIKNHMLLVHGNALKMRPQTIEKYFFNQNLPGENLLKLSFADISATILEKGHSDFGDFKNMLKRIKELKKLSANKKELPQPILNGNEIMKEFKIKPGPRIGELLEILREKQLEGKIKDKKSAIKFLRGLTKMKNVF
ncbi:MAG: HD domain-containing protein [Patescibacteria group bacterium]|nr:HD domain-containing protein [Patescibacteria group bacterium]MDD5164712.1 HD domain-containing protein [Patescibacteria group bacterium]MDD5534188.1 HD domain-containing protein [Patescibacteria group bacterium]